MAIEIRDEIDHVQSLAKRIKQIVGTIQDLCDIKNDHKTLLPIKDAIDDEKSAYNQFIKFYDSGDYFTQDLVIMKKMERF